ncbi:MAG TPA: hypothetical protein VK889_04255 [Solirubrobacterales bacterium]|nr:hypothetical protein [Solirubrobacterales bacterium]
MEEVDRRRPDYLVPAETKGARVLEAVLRYAGDELGSPITVPVLYGTALAYMDPDTLGDLRLLVVDDAVRTGANLTHHKQRARNYGATDVQAVACIGDGAHEHDDVDCYLTVGEKTYAEYVWQLTELVAAQGLPPEVDHHIFEIRLPFRIAGIWGELQRLLSGYGHLTVDSSAHNRDEVLGMTLHFPRFAPRGSAGEGQRHEIDKIRFFPDLANNCFYAIPVKFPALELPPARIVDLVPISEARNQLEKLGLGEDGPATVLIEEAKTLNAKTLFRALSTGAEFESIRGFSRALWRAFPDATIEAQEESFERLYGPHCGRQVAAQVAVGLAAIAKEEEGQPAESPTLESGFEPTYLDEHVVKTTDEIVGALQDMYDRHREKPDHDPYERIGYSIPEIVKQLDYPDPVLASRCIDYGLAMTVLVPFTGFDEHEDRLCVERRYRVSEIKRGGEPESYLDIGDARVELSEQVIALLCHNLIVRCRDGRASISPSEIALLVAILRPLVLRGHAIPLVVEPRVEPVDPDAPRGRDGEAGNDGVPQILLQKEERPIRFEERMSSSSYFCLDDEGHLTPSEHFTAEYDEGALPLNLRRSIEGIEARVKILLSLLDPLSPEERDQLMKGWAMSTDWRLGLTHVRHSLLAAIETMEKPLRLIQRGSSHPPSGGVAEEVDGYCAQASNKLELLGKPWEQSAKKRWESPLQLERGTLESMAAPLKPLTLYQLPDALSRLIAALGAMVARLDAVSVELGREPGAGDAENLAALATEVAIEVRRKLTSLDDEAPQPSPALDDPRKAIQRAAGELSNTLRLLKAFLAAATGIYRGAQDARIARPPTDKRNSSVLSLDIAGSRAHEEKYPQTHREWRSDGLDVAAQWGRAFSGREGKHREGDDLWFEFAVGDAAVIAAACVQCQASALASTGLDAIKREFHAAVDAGELEEGNKGNTQGPCMDRVTKVAKACDRQADTNYVFVTKDAWTHCSADLRDAGVRDERWEAEAELDDGTPITPVAIDSERLLRRYCERLAELAAAVRARVGEETSAPPTIEAEAERRGDEGQGGASAAEA